MVGCICHKSRKHNKRERHFAKVIRKSTISVKFKNLETSFFLIILNDQDKIPRIKSYFPKLRDIFFLENRKPKFPGLQVYVTNQELRIVNPIKYLKDENFSSSFRLKSYVKFTNEKITFLNLEGKRCLNVKE